MKINRIDQLIRDKNLQSSHSQDDIHYIVNSYVGNIFSDDQMKDWLVAVCRNGMDFNETIDYTNEIVNSGEKIIFKNKRGFFIDKHSTGGVGDKVSLILGPILAACGCFVPMIVGRALGHTGGTLDKLESIPNYNGLLKTDKFKKIVNNVGISIIGQTNEICPADKKIYALRSKTNTIKSFSLICGSIMGKKIAEGTEGLVLDIKTGNGAFLNKKDEALQLGKFLTKIGEEFNIKVNFAITDMNQPLGCFSGLICEVIESIEVLKGGGPKDLIDIVYHLGKICLRMAGIDNPEMKIKQVLNNGTAYEVLCRMVYEHGGLLKEMKFNPKEINYIKSDNNGSIDFIDTKQIGHCINSLCYQDSNNTIKIDNQAGCEIFKKIGESVKRDEIIAKIFCSNKDNLRLVKKKFKEAFKISNDSL